MVMNWMRLAFCREVVVPALKVVASGALSCLHIFKRGRDESLPRTGYLKFSAELFS